MGTGGCVLREKMETSRSELKSTWKRLEERATVRHWSRWLPRLRLGRFKRDTYIKIDEVDEHSPYLGPKAIQMAN